MTNVLEVDGLTTEIRTRRATVRPVDGVSFTVAPGQTVGLVGESGSGKSMTGLTIMGLLPAGGRRVSGSVRIAGQDVTSWSEKRLRGLRGNEIAMVFQDSMTALNPTLSIGDQIGESVRVHRGASRRAARARAAEMLDLVGIAGARERLDARPHELSGGLRQRVAIAIALACEPRIVIADEPTTALDVTTQAQILELLDSLKRQLNMGLVIVTHDMGVVAERADTVLVMYAGRVVESAPVLSLFRQPRHPYTRALLASVPNVELGRKQRLVGIPGSPPDLASIPSGCRFAPRCARAEDRCRDEDPRLTAETPEHAYACFFPINAIRAASETADDAPTSDLGAPAEADVHVTVDHVVKEFPLGGGLLRRRRPSVKAVSDVSLTVRRGETLGLVGESGCGKSTLARLIVGLEKPDAGRITVDGEPLRSGRRRSVGHVDPQLVFQDPYGSMNPRMRIMSVLREPLVAQRRGSRSAQRGVVRRLLDDVGLPARAAELYPHEFSGGQRQRIGLARALALEPDLVVADEPVSALDVSVQAQVLNLMVRLQRSRSLTYVVISHDLSVVRYVADRIGVMYLGQLVELGPADEIYERPAHPYTAGLLEALPVPEPADDGSVERPVIRGDLPSPVDPPSGCRFRTRCARAQDICAREKPVLRPYGSGGHVAACHVPLLPSTDDDGSSEPDAAVPS